MKNLKVGTIEELPTSGNTTKLNCIDLSSSDTRNSASLLKQACMDSGFFYVINHGLSQEFMDEVFAQSKRFFTLPLEDKMKLLASDKNRGYTPLLKQLLDPINQKDGDYKEIYDIGVEIPEDHPDAEKPFFGPNLWPVEGHISDPANGIYGAGAHTDFVLITLLATDEVMGLACFLVLLIACVSLEICKDKEAKPQEWEYIPPRKGAFIVNLGDVLERWSNGVFRSTLHRVLGNGQERYSIAFFVSPSYDHVLECLPTCKSIDNPPKFPPIKAGDYIVQRLTETYATKST